MSRIGLAFSCFFKLLFGKKLPAAAAAYLPAGESSPGPGSSAKALPAATPAPATAPAAAPAPVAKPRVNNAALHREGALAMLGLLQREGRLIDFLREPLDGFADADIGAAARDVHRGCRAVIEQHLTLEPVLPGEDDSAVSVPRGFDPAEIRVIGEVRGEPPFAGKLRHHGWRATEIKLPNLAEGVDRAVLAPAEVEVG